MQNGSRKLLIIGNWKMHTTGAQATGLAKEIALGVGPRVDIQVVLCPPFTVLEGVSQVLSGSTVQLGAQNLYPGPMGAVTGEVCAEMLKAVYCAYVLVGHSERRVLLREPDELINQKIHTALENRIKPVLCIGEPLEVRDSGNTWPFLQTQLERALDKVPQDLIENVVIAYEPLWAIGSGQPSSPDGAQAVHAQIRQFIDTFSSSAAKLRILYGGSVKPENAQQLLAQPDIDGLLVGGASLKAKSFLDIIG